VPAGEQVGVYQPRVEVGVSLGQEDVVVRLRRSMTAEHRLSFELELHGRLEGAEPLDACLADLLERPVAHLGLLGRRLLGDVGAEQERVGVPEHRRAVERQQALEGLRRLRSSLDRVPETDQRIDADPLDVFDDRPKRDVVAMLVGEESEAHPA
jgi:hypothetical protein